MFFIFLLCSLKSFADILNRLLKLSLQNYENFLFYIFQLMLPKCVLFFLTMKLISSNIKKVQWSLAASLIFLCAVLHVFFLFPTAHCVLRTDWLYTIVNQSRAVVLYSTECVQLVKFT